MLGGHPRAWRVGPAVEIQKLPSVAVRRPLRLLPQPLLSQQEASVCSALLLRVPLASWYWAVFFSGGVDSSDFSLCYPLVFALTEQ